MSFMLELKEFVAGGANTLVMGFMVAFIIALLVGFVKGMSGMDPKHLFTDGAGGRVSHTKYWANVAYLSATIAFLVINLFYFKEAKDQIEVLWLIFLGVVASNATISKFIGLKYKTQAGDPTERRGRVDKLSMADEYDDPRYRRQTPLASNRYRGTQSVDDPDRDMG